MLQMDQWLNTTDHWPIYIRLLEIYLKTVWKCLKNNHKSHIMYSVVAYYLHYKGASLHVFVLLLHIISHLMYKYDNI